MDINNPIVFNKLCWIWMGIALVLFPILLKVTQPYGKHSKRSWGPMINNKLGWIIMELPALLLFAYFAFSKGLPKEKMVVLAILLWALHYIHRSLIFPFKIHTKGKKMPVLIMVFAIFFNSVNAFLNGYWLSHFPSLQTGEYSNLFIVIGTLVFIAGTVINRYHDHILIGLRNNNSKNNTGYKIPYGGLFKYVSCPNFLGEIIIWTGFFILTQSPAALSFLVWTLVNLVTRALDHHKWYKNTFEDYPKERKALVPKVL